MDVLVLMGSANDYDVAKRVVPLFRRFGIDHTLRLHRLIERRLGSRVSFDKQKLMAPTV